MEELIEIKNSEFYSNRKFWPFMPEDIFAALEKSEIDGSPVTRVSKRLFDQMMLDYKKSKR